MTKHEAIKLGERHGEDDVDTVLREQGREIVIATLRPGHLGWDEGAINARAHRLVGVPEEHRLLYYEAYARAGRTRAEQIRDKT